MNKLILLFLICAILNYLFIINKDDDISQKLATRKPTPQESVRRARYVITRIFSALFGGSIIFGYTAKYVLLPSGIISAQYLSKNYIIVFVWIFSFIALLLLRIFQNIIRKLQDRPPRPFFDVVTLRRNIENFGKNR